MQTTLTVTNATWETPFYTNVIPLNQQISYWNVYVVKAISNSFRIIISVVITKAVI